MNGDDSKSAKEQAKAAYEAHHAVMREAFPDEYVTEPEPFESLPFEERGAWAAACGAACRARDVAWKERGDKPLPEDEAIEAAFPTRSGGHEIYAEAARLVGARHSKAGLVELVNWLLHERARMRSELWQRAVRSEGYSMRCTLCLNSWTGLTGEKHGECCPLNRRSAQAKT